MTAHKSPMPVARALAALAGFAVLAWVIALTGFWQVMAPDPQTISSSTQPTKTVRKVITTADAAPPSEGPFVVSGQVRGDDGGPLPNIPLMWDRPESTPNRLVQAHLTKTDEDGRYTVELPSAGRLTPGLTSTPEAVYIDSDRSDVDFIGVARCPVAVTVLGPDGAPIADQTVRARVEIENHSATSEEIETTNASGVADFTGMSCGVAEIWVRRAGFPQGRRDQVDTLVDQTVTIQLVNGVRVSGHITDLEDQPIEGARVHSGNASDRTEPDGSYGLLVDPRNLSRVNVSAKGFESESERLRIATADAAETELVLDFVLSPARVVTVYCAGLPDDSCSSVLPIWCTRTYLPIGEPCRGDPTTCRCPDGAGAIRGGGLAVELGPDDTEVWLDMSGRGGIRGQVLISGDAVDPSLGQCDVIATRLPSALEDIPGGMSAGATSSCLGDGQFEILGLKAGTYMVMVRTTAGEGNDPSIVVDTDVVDIGSIDIGGGGRITGVVLDGVTGEGAPGVAVVAYSTDGTTLSGMGQTTSGAEGAFTISGLGDGNYEVILSSRPFNTELVTISDGTSDSIELTTGEAGLLESNGFQLETDDAGRLVVQSVDAEGGAAAGGLEEGDVVVGVTIAGMDIGEVMPGLADEITDSVLDHWGGPGVGLVVERDGQRETIAFQ